MMMMMYPTLCGTVIAVLLSSASSQVATPCAFSAANGTYCANWVVDASNNIITFNVTAQTSGWVGIAVSMNPSGHSDTDSLVGWVDANGIGFLFDGISNAVGQPLLDSVNNTQLIASTEANGITSLVFQRNLISSDVAEDTDIWNMPMTLAWAIGTNDGTVDANNSPSYMQHSVRGAATVNLLAGTAAVSGSYSANGGNFQAMWFADVVENVLIMSVSAATTGWVGVGFSNSGRGHSDTDSAVGWVTSDGQGLLFDGYSVQQSQPTTDINDLMMLQSSEINGRTSLVFSRGLMVDGDNDIDLMNNDMTLAWAYGGADGALNNAGQPTYNQHPRANRGTQSVNFLQESTAAGQTFTKASLISVIVASIVLLF